MRLVKLFMYYLLTIQQAKKKIPLGRYKSLLWNNFAAILG